MSDKKIRVSWDEVSSPSVDQKISQQEALNRAQSHYQPHVPQPRPGDTESGGQTSSIWYNTIFYMTLFGLAGGFFGWLAGEVIWQSLMTPADEFRELIEKEAKIYIDLNDGELTEREAIRKLEDLYEEHEDNPYVEVALDESLSDWEKEDELEKLTEKDQFKSFVRTLLWTSCIGVIIALFLATADQAVSRNWRGVIVNGSVGATLGLVGGVACPHFLYQGL